MKPINERWSELLQGDKKYSYCSVEDTFNIIKKEYFNDELDAEVLRVYETGYVWTYRFNINGDKYSIFNFIDKLQDKYDLRIIKHKIERIYDNN